MELSGNIKKFLTQANSKWEDESKRAKEEGGYKNVPLGRYIARLTDAQLEESATSGRVQIKWAYVVIDGDHTGDPLRIYDGLDRDDAMFYLAQTFLKFGIEADEIIWDSKKSKDEMFITNVLKQMVKEKPIVDIRVTKDVKTGDLWPRLVGLNETFEADDETPEEAEKETETEEPPKEDPPKNKGGRPPKSTTPAATPDPKAKGKKAPDPEPEPEEVEEEEETEEAEEEEEVALEVGMEVEFTFKGEKMRGKIKEVLADEEKLKISIGGKIYTVGLDKITGTV